MLNAVAHTHPSAASNHLEAHRLSNRARFGGPNKCVIGGFALITMTFAHSVEVSAAPAAGSHVLGSVALDAGSYGIIHMDFFADQIRGTASSWSLALPYEFSDIIAYSGRGTVQQTMESDAYRWTVDTIGSSDGRACFSGLAASGPDDPFSRYTICVMAGGVGSPTGNRFFSRWDFYGATMPETPVVGGELHVR